PRSAVFVHRFEGALGDFLGSHSSIMFGSKAQLDLTTGDVFDSITPVLADGGTLVAYAWHEFKQATYLIPDGFKRVQNYAHIGELYVSANNPWTNIDLTMLTDATRADGRTLVGYAWNQYKQVAYLTGDGHVHELSVGNGQPWSHADLTQITGAPAAEGRTLAGYAWNQYKQVAYLTGDGHVHELFVGNGQPWSHADLTQITGAPAAEGRTLAGY